MELRRHGNYRQHEVVALALTGHYGLLFATAYSWVKGAAYFCGVLIWTVYLLHRESRAPIDIDTDNHRLRWSIFGAWRGTRGC